MDDYRMIADQVAADIAAGRLQPGTQLPPQRRFARQHGIANSTAARVYGELTRRRLVVGEVGRGTFVRATTPRPEPALAEPSTARIDLELNFPVLPGHAELLAGGLTRLLRADPQAAVQPTTVAGTPPAREAAAALLARAGWQPDPGRLLFTGSGRQAIAAAIAALVPAGERLGVEALTYPVVKGIASRLGVTLVPLPMDEAGLIPDELAATPHLRAIYVQPTLHNPLGTTTPDHRRAELADILRRRRLYAIEDTIYGFLRKDVPPWAAMLPEQTVVVDSLTKRLAPGLTVGFLSPPAALADRVASAARSGTWTASRFAVAAATQWITDGTAATIEQEKTQEAAARQRLTRDRLADFAIHADPHAYHCWWTLPEPWRAETFVAAAARRGIAVTPAAAFTVGQGHAPSAVRLALASPPPDLLADALNTLAELARATPEDISVE